MRAKDYLKKEKEITGSYEDKVMSCARGIITRDRFDTQRCDVILVNFLGAKKVSIGTVMEIAWADSIRTPIICAIESTGNPHDHPMVTEAIGFRVASLDEAVECAIKILGTGMSRDIDRYGAGLLGNHSGRPFFGPGDIGVYPPS